MKFARWIGKIKRELLHWLSQWVLLQAVSIELIFINIDSDVFTDYSSLVVVVQDVFLLAMSNSV